MDNPSSYNLGIVFTGIKVFTENNENEKATDDLCRKSSVRPLKPKLSKITIIEAPFETLNDEV